MEGNSIDQNQRTLRATKVVASVLVALAATLAFAQL